MAFSLFAGVIATAPGSAYAASTASATPTPPQAYSVKGVTLNRPKVPVSTQAMPRYKTAATHLPAAATGTTQLAVKTGTASAVRNSAVGQTAKPRVTVPGTPVWVQQTTDTGPDAVTATISPQSLAKQLGVSGVVFTVSGTGSSGELRVGLDYSAFADAYGGDFGSRLQLYTLPSCALTTPQLAKCRVRTPVTGQSDSATAHYVSGLVKLGGSTAPAGKTAAGHLARAQATAQTSPTNPPVLAAAAGTGEEGASTGNYSASKIAPEGSWAAGGSEGDFTYDYPITVPSATGTLAPKVALDYDSGAVDGKTSMTGAQASRVGDGWAAPADNYVTQTFVPCDDEPEGSAGTAATQDMCYDGNVLTVSLNGMTTTIVDDNGTYKLLNDNGATITHEKNSNKGQGTYNDDYWVITERDGTSYYFGMNQLPGWSSTASPADPTTNSVDWEPVYSDHSGDPCYSSSGSFSTSVCDMAYLWHLDYVTDVHGNAMAYFYGQTTNYYGEDNGASDVAYISDSHLTQIDYGFTTASGAFSTYPDKVVFTSSLRCALSSGCDTLNSSISTADAANQYPDIPTDLLCSSGQKCTSDAPSFFSQEMLTAITTYQYSTSASAYAQVDSYALTQDFPASGDNASGTLWLESIQRTGEDTSAGGSTTGVPDPKIVFKGSDVYPNRYDASTYPALFRWRVSEVDGEFGAKTSVTYSVPKACSTSITPSTNTTSCYPVYWTPPGYTAPIMDWFVKYAVSEVTVDDTTGGNEEEVTQYTYNTPAWHYDDTAAVQAKYRTYGQFRGYQSVTTLLGDGTTEAQDASTTLYYQGMYGDYLSPTSSRTSTITDSAGGVHTDYDQLSGLALETETFDGNSTTLDHATVDSYWVSGATATQTLTGLPTTTAAMDEPSEKWTEQRTTDGGTVGWDYTETDYGYDTAVTDPDFGLPEHEYAHAWTSTDSTDADAAYDRCTSFTYAPVNSGENLVGLVASQQEVSVPCTGYVAGSPASAPSSSSSIGAPATFTQDQVMAATETYYDDPTFSATFPQTTAPTTGDVTMTQVANGYASGAFTYQPKSKATYDSYGRVEDSYDAMNNETVTTYTLNSVGLTTGQSVKNPLGQTSSETLDPTRALVLTATDPNGVVTTKQYDALGRATAEWDDSRYTATSTPAANYLTTYVESNTGLSGTTVEKMNDELGYTMTVSIDDSLGRTRETQANTPDGGMLVTDTFYNSLGQVSKKYNAWWDQTATPSLALTSNVEGQVPNEDVYTYDGLGHQVEDVSEYQTTPVSTSYTVYSGDATTAIPPTGGQVKTTVTDPIGQTVSSVQYTAAPTLHTPANLNTGYFYITGGTALTTNYGFDGHGNQSTTTDPDKEVWTSDYNLLGQVTETIDPTGGDSYMQYDANGDLLQSEDSRGKYVSYTYDALKRKTAEYASTSTTHSAGPTGNQTAAWFYDNSNAVRGVKNPIGHLTTEISYANGAASTKQFTGFNIFGESLGETYTIGSGAGKLAGTYYYVHTYSIYTGLLLTDVYYSEAGGALPAETVNHGYSTAFDLPNTIGSAEGYAQNVEYDGYGRVSQETIGSVAQGTNAYGQAFIDYTYDPHTGKLIDELVKRGTTTPANVDETAYKYDLFGNTIQQTETRLGSSTDTETQCFGYDGLDELTSAWTATDACATAPSSSNSSMVGNTLGTNSAYWTSWTYDNEGDRKTQDQHSLTSSIDDANTTDTYSATQPHTLTGTATTVNGTQNASTGYGYDTAGNTINRTTAAQGTQTLSWNNAEQLTQVASTTAGTSSYLYDADGNLLVQTDPTTTTLYLEGEQLVYNSTTAAYSGTRYYPLPGGGTAVRTGSAATAFDFEIADQHNTNELYLDYTAQVPTWRQFDPFGNPRGTSTSWVDNHGFLNKATDSTTGLTDVGARWYDPATGRFVSLDQQFEADDVTQIGGYAYAGENPVTNSDPSGGCVNSFGDTCGSAFPFDDGTQCPSGTTCGWDGTFQTLANQQPAFGSSRPDWFWNPGAYLREHALWASAKAVAEGGQALGLSDAASMFSHYLDGSGTDYYYDADKPFFSDAGFQSAVESRVQTLIGAANKTGADFEMGTPGAFTFHEWDDPDWYAAVRTGFLNVRIVREANGDWQATIQLTSVYYFHSPEQFGPFSGAALEGLVGAGLAQDFRSIGQGTLTFDPRGNLITTQATEDSMDSGSSDYSSATYYTDGGEGGSGGSATYEDGVYTGGGGTNDGVYNIPTNNNPTVSC